MVCTFLLYSCSVPDPSARNTPDGLFTSQKTPTHVASPGSAPDLRSGPLRTAAEVAQAGQHFRFNDSAAHPMHMKAVVHPSKPLAVGVGGGKADGKAPGMCLGTKVEVRFSLVDKREMDFSICWAWRDGSDSERYCS